MHFHGRKTPPHQFTFKLCMRDQIGYWESGGPLFNPVVSILLTPHSLSGETTSMILIPRRVASLSLLLG